MMPTIEEIATPDIAAEIEHREWERGNEQRERWEAVEATHGPLLTAAEWEQHTIDQNAWFDEDDHDSTNDGHGTLADDAWHDAHEFPEW